MLVIGVGLPRTGTLSTALALSTLLKCKPDQIYHGMQIIDQSKERLSFWLRAYGGHVTKSEWQAFFKDHVACFDLPAILFYKDLMVAFPDAKIVMTVRDPESWFESWHNSIALSLQLVEKAPYKWFHKHDKAVQEVHSGARSFKVPWCNMTLNEAFETLDNAKGCTNTNY